MEPDDRYRVVRFEPSFEDQIVELQKHLWSPFPSVNSAYLKWKYTENPYRDEVLIYLALHGDRVVGMRGFFAGTWECGEPAVTFRGLAAGDLVVEPEHRDRGLHTRIMRHALEDLGEKGYEYIFNLSGSPVTRVGSLLMGWRSVGMLDPMERVRAGASDAGAAFEVLDERSRRPDTARVIVSETPRPKEMAGLIERIGPTRRIRHVRDERFFAWRFENPMCRYRFLYAGGDDTLGYLVLQASGDPKASDVAIVDWEATDRRTLGGLLEAALTWAPFPLVRTWLPADEAKAELLRAHGFEGSTGRERVGQDRPTVLVRSLRNDRPQDDWTMGDLGMLDLESWDLRMIYSDAF